MVELRETVTSREAARILGVGVTTIIRWIGDGRLEAYKLDPLAQKSWYRIYLSSVEAFLEQRKVRE